MTENKHRWRQSRTSDADSDEESRWTRGDSKEAGRDDDRDKGRPPQACSDPTVDPLPAVPDDELSGLSYAIERAGLLYYRSCRAVASAINRLKEMTD